MTVEERMETITMEMAENEERISYMKEQNKRLRAAYTKLFKIQEQLKEFDRIV